MYLKRLEMVGFKSFAERTRLDFEPGMMAIVGPNGCGKSNIADAIRWVLGEQSAKALRGAKMEDVIFNGTDAQKALGIAEVSLTLADCEAALGTEYHEVTVTRRVFRTGEGQYLINKTPCRLKDIQRLFMDTGVGTNSYSLMEQGRIDRVLSSRPEDRRAVFEEASGITKYKADKKEAIRKLEHTEANLLRLADILREVKRQIISLQRQAGKARRYREIQDQLRGQELFFARDRMADLDRALAGLETQRAGLAEREEALVADVTEAETRVDAVRAELSALDREIEETREQVSQGRAEVVRAQELIQLNSARIQELERIAQRDSEEADVARRSLAEAREALERLTAQVGRADEGRRAAEEDLSGKTAALREREDRVDRLGRTLHQLREDLVRMEHRSAELSQELTQMETRERESVRRRERLSVEQAETRRVLSQAETRQAAMTRRVESLQGDTARRTEEHARLETARADRAAAEAALRADLADLQARAAARRAETEVLARAEAAAEGFPGGARLLLDPGAPVAADRSALLGALAGHLRAEADYRGCLEAALRPWLDALVARDAATALACLREVERQQAGAARILAVPARATAAAAAPLPGEALLDHVACSDDVRPLAQCLLGDVRVLASLADLPEPLPEGVRFVTRAGHLAGAPGAYEFWAPETSASPLARRQQLDAARADLAQADRDLADRRAALERLQGDETELAARLRAAADALAEARRAQAHAEGEHQVVADEARQSRERAEVVAFELGQLAETGSATQQRRESIAAEMETLRRQQAEARFALGARTDELRAAEQERNAALAEVTDARVAAGDSRREAETFRQRQESQTARVTELETLIRERAQGVTDYRARIADLHQTTAAARDSLQPLEDEARLHEARLADTRRRREDRLAIQQQEDHLVRERRTGLDQVRQSRGRLDVEIAEQKMRRQTLLDRVTGEYKVSLDDIRAAAEPEWGDAGAPADREALETLIAEQRARLESMGPVNLVAIDEYQELEQRYNFLNAQQDDLVKAKQQLLDMIRRINQTTTQMFAETFAKVNENFREMFVKLFGGGAAKLVLVDETDVLESGIEIIARPPGKKLQTVSLLSGGERTMTAVALLFALYLVKPSPFCLLDELDAALDDSNIGRFVSVVSSFLTTSQFIVITHNRQTIGASNVLFGVTMEKHGISKIVSVKFNREHQIELALPAGEREPVAAEPVEAPPAAPEPAAEPPTND